MRRYPQSGLNGFGLWSTRNKWFSGLGLNPSSDELASSFTNYMNTAFDHFFPVNTIKFHPTDKPWITGHIKQLIKERQRAFHTGDAQLWRQYRRRVQIEIKTRKNNFYTQKSITCEKTMSVNGGTLLTQCQVERKVNLSLQLSVTDSYFGR